MSGSDDARGPQFPAHVYGSRPDPPKGAVGVYGNRRTPQSTAPLTTIAEMSYVSVSIIFLNFCPTDQNLLFS